MFTLVFIVTWIGRVIPKFGFVCMYTSINSERPQLQRWRASATSSCSTSTMSLTMKIYVTFLNRHKNYVSPQETSYIHEWNARNMKCTIFKCNLTFMIYYKNLLGLNFHLLSFSSSSITAMASASITSPR